MFLRALAAAAVIALSVSSAYAGKTSSHTITAPVHMADGAEVVEVCDAFVFDYDLNYSVTFVVSGEVTDWFAITEANVEAFATLWNNKHPENKVPEGVEFDAVIGFTDPDGSITGEAGEYALLYNDGCFVVFIKAPLPPANVSPPEAVKVQWESLKQWQMFGYVGLR